ncbi:MAG TPA: STAS domain-containing protein [Kofleriaceae bacterium]|jgi:rsbT co-antagonist protein RsbR|nr:STAS domain-containing protein [Kofleriaceae bacterium]
MLERIADALLVLSNVGFGDLDGRVVVEDDADHPLAALFAGINETIEALRVEREKNRAYQAELEEKLTTIEQQRNAIRELSTPVMEIWDGVLCLPVVGVVDSARSAQMTDVLLQTISMRGSRCAIVDITGIEVMDTKTVDHFVRMAKAVRLLGAECLLTGVSPNIAHTMVHMGVTLTDITTYRSLREALRSHVAQRGRRR